jgi:hypothetical protein
MKNGYGGAKVGFYSKILGMFDGGTGLLSIECKACKQKYYLLTKGKPNDQVIREADLQFSIKIGLRKDSTREYDSIFVL